jgi:hypothetical protein
MHRELELLVLAYDAMIGAEGEEAKRTAEIYDSQLEDSLELHPGISSETLGRMVMLAHRNWVKAQKKPSSMPPKA